MSKTLLIEGPVKSVVANLAALLVDAAPGDYFIFAPSVGIIRARKSSQISWQWWGIGCPKARLIAICEKAPKSEEVYTLPVTIGAYGLDMIETLIEARREQKTSENLPTDTPPSEGEGKKKKKKKDKAQEEQTENDAPTVAKVSKKILEAPRTKKEIKKALKSCAIWDKAQCKEMMGYLTFTDGETTLNDVLADIEAGTGSTMTEETLNLLVAIL